MDVAGGSLKLAGHDFRHGERALCRAGSAPIGGLTDGGFYHVLHAGPNAIRLSTTLRGVPVALTSAGAGTASLRKTLDVMAVANRDECTRFEANSAYAGLYTATGTW